MKHTRRKPQLLRITRSLLIMSVALCFTSTSVLMPVYAERLPDSELTALDYYPNWVGNCGSDTSADEGDTTGTVTPGHIYIMGDSITGLAKSTYISKFKSPWSPTVEGLDSRQIATIPPSPSGLAQLDQDKIKIESAKAIVIALGTNGTGNSASAIEHDVNRAMAKVKTHNKSSAPVFWVNVIDTRYDSASRKTNKAIKDAVGSDGTIIDWYKEAKDKANLASFNMGVHPTKQKDIDLLVNLVYDTVVDSGNDGADAAAGDAAPAAVSPGRGKPDGAAFPDLDPAGMAASINKFIRKANSKSKMKGLGTTIVASAEAADVSPFLIVAIANKESGLSDPGDYNVSHGNNSFGRSATSSQPNFSGARLWYKWSSVKASVDHTAAENKNAAGGGDIAAYLRKQYPEKLKGGDLLSLFMLYAPPGDNNNTAAYADDVKGWIKEMVTGVAPGGQAEKGTPAKCCPSDAGGGGSTLTGKTNGIKAYNFLKDQGLSDAAASGVVGNFTQESIGVEPQRLQGDYTGRHKAESLSPGQLGQAGLGWGVAQFTPPKTFITVAKNKGASYAEINSLTYQVNHIYKLISGPQKNYYKFPQLKAAKTPEEAATIFLEGYERGNPAPTRQAYARAYYNLATKGTPLPENVPVSTSDESAASDVGGAGISEDCEGAEGNTRSPGVNGWDIKGDNAMTVFDQCDNEWGSRPYGAGKSSICASGCGITSLAMVVRTLKGGHHTPLTLANKYGAKYHSFGTDWSLWPVAARDLNMNMKDIGVDLNKAAQTVKSGGLVIISVDAGEFTSVGHFMVIRAVTDDGKFLLADPNYGGNKSKGKDTNNKAYSAEFLKTQGSLKHLWAWTK